MTGGSSVSFIIGDTLLDYRWSFFITVKVITNTTYCALDMQLHGIKNQLESKLNEQQATLELLKKQHDQEPVRCAFKIILKVPKYSIISSNWKFMLVYNKLLSGHLWITDKSTASLVIWSSKRSNYVILKITGRFMMRLGPKSSGDGTVRFEMEIFKFLMKSLKSLR